MLRMMRNLPGNSPMTGLTLRATGLYFFAAFFLFVGGRCDVRSMILGVGMSVMVSAKIC